MKNAILLSIIFALGGMADKSIAQSVPGERILIVYLSRTSNTKAIAEMIQRNVGGRLVANGTTGSEGTTSVAKRSFHSIPMLAISQSEKMAAKNKCYELALILFQDEYEIPQNKSFAFGRHCVGQIRFA